MQIIEQSVAWFQPPPDNTMQLLELAGRVAYKSEDKITEDSAARFIAVILTKQHESVIEHVSASVRIITDRGVSHELVRHRLASYTQESTRYCRYAKGITVIKPVYLAEDSQAYWRWYSAMQDAENHYILLLDSYKLSPQEARAVLPTSLKTELVMTANLRQWAHVFKLRTAKEAHPQMRVLMLDTAALFHDRLPLLFPVG